MRTAAPAIVVFCFLFFAQGCGNREGATLSGNVTLDDKPLEAGTISFYPTGDTRGPATATDITSGRYSISDHDGIVVGTSRTEITAFEKTGNQVPDHFQKQVMIDEMKPIIPARYNENTELIVEIRAGTNARDFHLKSP